MLLLSVVLSHCSCPLIVICLLACSVVKSTCFVCTNRSSALVPSASVLLLRSTSTAYRNNAKYVAVRVQERSMIPSGSEDPSSVVRGEKTPSSCTSSQFSSTSFLPAPPGVDYTMNPTVFGKILLGKSKAIILDESHDLLAFYDIRPRALLHGLVIPKQYIPTILDLGVDNYHHNGNNSLNLLQKMHSMAHQILKKHLTPQQYQDNDYILCFHIPPFNSVDHLHLHILAPASQMSWIWKEVKYNTRTRWCISFKEVYSRIQEGQTAVPYTRTDSWWTILHQVFCPIHGRNDESESK
jgi:diadenosine tetraphosphate (Ap4A) HIT family hydrolase